MKWNAPSGYAAQSWNFLGLGYEVVNTYPLSMCHNNNTLIKGDGNNRITTALVEDGAAYVMRTYIQRDSSGRLAEADININVRDVEWTVGTKSGYCDVQSVMAHEMGHVVGMAHCYESFSSAWTMYYKTLENSIAPRSLENGDKYMFSSIYLNI